MRALHFSGIFLLFCAFVLTLVTSVSLPYLRTLDIARTHFGELQVTIKQDPTDELRLGVWAYCHYQLNGDRLCSSIGYAYSVLITDVANKSNTSIGSSWTRGLAIHPVSAVVTLAALLVSLVPNALTTLLIAAVLSFISMMLCFVAFLVDIALYAYLKFRIGDHANGLITHTGPGLWVNFAAMILTGLAMCSLFIRRRRQLKHGARGAPVMNPTEKKKKSVFSRFRRTKGST